MLISCLTVGNGSHDQGDDDQEQDAQENHPGHPDDVVELCPPVHDPDVRGLDDP